MWGVKNTIANELTLSLRSTQLISNKWEVEIHNGKIKKMIGGKYH